MIRRTFIGASLASLAGAVLGPKLGVCPCEFEPEFTTIAVSGMSTCIIDGDTVTFVAGPGITIHQCVDSETITFTVEAA